tara:strand:- start:560 stop:1129 length:570 start_codon:yes stop_codon:yes gene_type:complete
MFTPETSIGTDGLLPTGTLATAVIGIRGLKESRNGGQYLDGEFTVTSPNYKGRKVFTNIMDPFFAGNSDGAKNMGKEAISRALEGASLVDHADPSTYAPYGAGIMAVIDGLNSKEVPVEIVIEKGNEGFQDKNAIKFLTPNPKSGCFIKWQRLQQDISGENVETTSIGQSVSNPVTQSAPATGTSLFKS